MSTTNNTTHDPDHSPPMKRLGDRPRGSMMLGAVSFRLAICHDCVT
jgi:hypothetical protein